MNIIKYVFRSTTSQQISIINKKLTGIYEARRINLKKMKHKEMLTTILVVGAIYTKYCKNNIFEDDVLIRNWQFSEKAYHQRSEIDLTESEIPDFFKEIVIPTMATLSKYIVLFKSSYLKIRDMFANNEW